MGVVTFTWCPDRLPCTNFRLDAEVEILLGLPEVAELRGTVGTENCDAQ